MDEVDHYRRDRMTHADAMRALGVDPYGAGVAHRELWEPANMLALHSLKYDAERNLVPDTDKTADNGPEVQGYGRIVLHREMGNLHFITIRDYSGDIQIALSKKTLNERDWKLAKLLDLGDIIHFTGRCAPTKKGEPTVWVTSFDMGSKAIAPPPAKHEGLTDIELRYRKRYTDLWSNPEVLQLALTRSRIILAIRGFLSDMEYVEVETPILQTIAGGAIAKPFQTHHKALDIPMYMRIAPELFLKRLLVGGIPRVYEIGRNFRNEGLSPRHNPEFTALEMYEAFSDHEQMMELVEEMIDSMKGIDGVKFDAVRPWRKATMTELVNEYILNQAEDGTHLNVRCRTPEEYYEFFSHYVERTLIQPTFVTHLPATAVPLAKNDGHGCALAFELIVNGQEIGCGYSEQNNPAVQLDVFKKQIDAALDEHLKGNVEAHLERIDEDFLEALAVGMPPAGGVGIGIDRLVMMLTGATSIRDVILFPTMKPLE